MPITQTLRVSDASHHLVASPPKQRLLFLSDEGSSGLLFNMILIIFKSSPLDPSSERKSVLAFVSKPLFFEPTQKVIKLFLGGAQDLIGTTNANHADGRTKVFQEVHTDLKMFSGSLNFQHDSRN